MPEPSIRLEPVDARYRFGFSVMGPILAECCHALLLHLDAENDGGRARVLYCARGGLIIRRAFVLFQQRIRRTPPLEGDDLMVSRLAASRLALEMSPGSAGPLLALEFEGRSCAAAASVLSGLTVTEDGEWAQPYALTRLFELLHANSQGRHVHESMLEQAALLREHIASRSGGAQTLHVVDTGVFGSIGHFLSLGLPDKTIHPILLFRANYKRRADLPLPAAKGLIFDEDHYCPWKPRSVSRLYWPFIEAFFEPDLPSVRSFGRDADGEVTSNLQFPGWHERLSPTRDRMRSGAFDYLRTLDPNAVSSIEARASEAWHALRKRIVYPALEDLALLGVASRGVDFGFDDLVSFDQPVPGRDAMPMLARVRSSIWPEGEVRRTFPKAGGVCLRMLEAGRFFAAAARVAFPDAGTRMRGERG